MRSRKEIGTIELLENGQIHAGCIDSESWGDFCKEYMAVIVYEETLKGKHIKYDIRYKTRGEKEMNEEERDQLFLKAQEEERK